ncbi:hypothetical protein MNBD_GAMMA13-480 [hydrothermal vent metagenome]|uniref:Uncharacterized protein n=1 Tax=hydrothermal vent metagenome TaxID=652676 RepID=A0A3B0YCY2_9ZZZZ
MKEILDYRDVKQNELRAHTFFKWMNSEGPPLNDKFQFMPIMIIFVMNFRDMNKWVIRFDDSDNELKAVINSSTTEDETHSRLFLEDWRKFHFDDHLDWKPSDVLWWLFLADDTEPFRRFGVDFMRLCVDDNNDPLMRFAHSEAGEACGHVFFENIAPLAEKLSIQNGLNYRYFGMHHLELETGHVLESEGVFEHETLTAAQRQTGLNLAERMFTIFDGIHDSFYAYVEKYCEANTTPVRNCNRKNSRAAEHEAEEDVISTPSLNDASQVDSSQSALQNHLNMRKEEIENHEFFHWMKETPLPAVKKLQRFIPLWAVDIFGYRDLNKYAMKYKNPVNNLEKQTNRIASNLSNHSQLFLQDWIELELDELISWPVSDMLDFLFLDYMMDTHRENLIKFGMLALKYKDPVVRLWFMDILEASGHSFFRNTRELALEAEKNENICLDYLADRHLITHQKYDTTLDADIKQLNVTKENKKIIDSLIDIVFDALTKNLDLSLFAAKSNKFSIR